jgi:ribosomal small subunit protein bTHX
MGKGDKKTRRGKIIAGSYGVSRKRKSKKIQRHPCAPCYCRC